MMDKSELNDKYLSLKNDYDRLGANSVDALRTFLKSAGIEFLDIYYRVKKFDSLFEKISRKSYINPFEDIEDICGIRIICYYNSDIDKINKILNSEFVVIEQENVSDRVGLNEFAYRSSHFIVKINKDWLSAPNYRELGALKAEIQVRTVLMHAWAEIEHKLNYKSEAQVPKHLKRKLYLLSAGLESVDNEFENLRIKIHDYQVSLVNDVRTYKDFNLQQEFNLESFKIFIEYKFPDSDWSEFKLSNTFEEFKGFDDVFVLLNLAIDKYIHRLVEIIADLRMNGYPVNSQDETYVFLWFVVPLINDRQYKKCMLGGESSWSITITKWKELEGRID